MTPKKLKMYAPGRAAAATLRLLLDDYREDPPADAPSHRDWIVLADAFTVAELRATVLSPGVLAVEDESFQELEMELRARAESRCAVLRLRCAGENPLAWAEHLPIGAPSSEEIEALAGSDSSAWLSRLRLPDFGVVECLHAWRQDKEELQLLEAASGVLSIRTEEA